MLLQLKTRSLADINKILAFARENHLNLSLIDESQANFLLPGKPPLAEQLTRLIENSCKSGSISMNDAQK